ncbi:MAG TPA: hypothetical protein VGU20_26155 [Stellaceae bacterium]|nr:hypothetical protein [Stellaceae bacterium]
MAAPLSVKLKRDERVAIVALLPLLVFFGRGLACDWVVRGRDGHGRVST